MIKKVCGICNNPNKPIWKAKTRDNPCMCKDCYAVEKPSQKPPIKAREPIKNISDKQAKINSAYTVLRLQYLKMFPYCGVRFVGCTGVATTIHHKYSGSAKRTHYNDTSTWAQACMSCHEEIHTMPADRLYELDLKRK